MKQNLPCYNGDVAYSPLLVSYLGKASMKNLVPSHDRLQAPVAGSPTYYQFCIGGIDQLLGREPTWLDMYLTEPPVTSVRLYMQLPMFRPERGGCFTRSIKSIANELVHDARGLTFRTVMRRVKEICESRHWLPTGYSSYKLESAKVTVHLFAGT